MKIAFIVSSKNKIPPDKTGGVEYAVYYLIKELANKGHDIKLYAASGSDVKGVKVEYISPFFFFFHEHPNLEERIVSFYDLNFMAEFFYSEEWKKFDLIHYNNYIFYEILPFVKNINIPVIIRMNYPHDFVFKYLKKKMLDFKNVYYLPTSKFITSIMPGLPYLDPIAPTINIKDFKYSKKEGDYLLSIGRVCPEKGTHLAIEVALKSKKKLVIAGGVKKSHHNYFNEKIRPYIDNKNIIYVGEVDFKTKIKIYQKALATLFPIQWNEPFGLVLLESMACGTPVITFNKAATSEIVKHRESGFLVKDGNVSEMADFVSELPEIKRSKVRAFAENNFSISSSADKYEKICNSLIKKNKNKS